MRSLVLSTQVKNSPTGAIAFDNLPDAAMLRLPQIVGPLVPCSHSTWWRYVKAGKAPQPIKISPGVTAWRVGDIRAWLAGQQL